MRTYNRHVDWAFSTRMCGMIVTVVAMLAMSSILETAMAADVEIDKSRDVNLKVWNTILGIRIGDPIYDGDLPKEDKAEVNKSWWATDTSTQQRFLNDNRVAHHAIGTVVEDSPGHFTMPQQNDWLIAKVGDRWVGFADLKAENTDIYVAVDAAGWINGGEPTYEPEVTTIQVNNGIEALQLPGYQIGTSEITFSETTGWVNPSPYTGDVTVIGSIAIRAPEPATLLLLGLGTLAVLRRRRA